MHKSTLKQINAEECFALWPSFSLSIYLLLMFYIFSSFFYYYSSTLFSRRQWKQLKNPHWLRVWWLPGVAWGHEPIACRRQSEKRFFRFFSFFFLFSLMMPYADKSLESIFHWIFFVIYNTRLFLGKIFNKIKTIWNKFISISNL